MLVSWCANAWKYVPHPAVDILSYWRFEGENTKRLSWSTVGIVVKRGYLSCLAAPFWLWTNSVPPFNPRCICWYLEGARSFCSLLGAWRIGSLVFPLLGSLGVDLWPSADIKLQHSANHSWRFWEHMIQKVHEMMMVLNGMTWAGLFRMLKEYRLLRYNFVAGSMVFFTF